MTKQRLLEDMEYMEEIMIRTADRCDIWQDRFIYMIARSIYDILKEIIKQKENQTNEM